MVQTSRSCIAAGESKLTTADLAVAVLDEIEKTKHIRMRFTVGY